MTTTTDTRTDLTTGGAPLRISDAGMETVLIFEHGFDLPEFAAFPLLDRPDGRAALLGYYRGFVDIADEHGVDLVLDTATWRASRAWGDKLGYGPDDLIVVLSDHGFEAKPFGDPEHGKLVLTGGHESPAARDGMLIARGRIQNIGQSHRRIVFNARGDVFK